MRLSQIQKAPTGYVLRYSKAVKALMLAPCIIFLSFGCVLPFVAERDAFTMVMACLFGAYLAGTSAYLFCVAFGYRIAVDETGVHRYSFRRVKHSILWQYVRSFGVDMIPVPSRYGTMNHLAFYASTETKPVSLKSKVFIKLTKEDEEAVRASGLLVFCRRQMAEADRGFK